MKAHQNWAKMSADLDGNPKIRRAGRLGREVFLFALRRNAARASSGVIPAVDLESWYVADQLQIPEEEAIAGLARAVAAHLLIEIDGGYAVGGWDDEWAKRPLTPTERQAAKRNRDASLSESDSRDVSLPESDCHAKEERRKEESERRPERDTRALVGPSDPAPPPQELPDPQTPEPQNAARDDREPRDPGPGGAAGSPGSVLAVPAGWSKLAFDAWKLFLEAHAKLRQQGIDPSSPAWAPMPHGNDLGDRNRELREQGYDLAGALVVYKHVLAVEVAKAKAKNTLRWLQPARVFSSKSFALSRGESPGSVASAPAGERRLRRDPPKDDAPDFGSMSPVERAFYADLKPKPAGDEPSPPEVTT